MHCSRINSVLALLMLSLLGPALLKAQSYRIGAAPDWVIQHDAADAFISDTACISGGVEYVLVDRQYDLATHAAYYNQIVKLTTADGLQEGARFSASVDPSFQRLTLHSLRVIRNGKILDRLLPNQLRTIQQEKDMDAYLYDGSITVVSDLQDVRVGDLVEYAYTVTGWDPTDDGRFHRKMDLAFSLPVGYCYTRIIVPAGRTLDVRTTGHASAERTVQKSGVTEHIWDTKDIPCVTVDDGAPAWFNAHPSLEVSEFKDVAALKAWADKLFAVDMRPSGELAERIQRLKELPDTLARMDSATAMVQREVRYLGFEDGIGAYRPHPPGAVFDQRFGDCKDKSLLLVSMLRSCGIQAEPALVNSSSGLRLNEQLPRPGMFDHCIVKATHDGTTYWLDATMTNNGGHASDRYTPDYGYALVLGSGGNELERMSVNNTGKIQILERLKVAAIGTSAELTAEVKYSGRLADAMRNTFANSSLSDLERKYSDYYSGFYGPCEVLSPLSGTFDAARNIFTTKEHYRIPQAWDTLNDGRTLQLVITATGIRDYLVVPTTPQRNAPLYLGQPVDIKQRIEVSLPEEWNAEPSTQRYGGYGVQYVSSLQVQDRTVIYEITYNVDSSQVAIADIPAFYAQQKSISNDLSYNFTWTPNVQGARSPFRAFSWGFVLILILAAIGGAIAVNRYDPPADPAFPRASHEGIGGFLFLPAIGLCLSPLLRGYQMLADEAAILRLPEILHMAYPDQGWSLLAYGVFAQAYNIGMLVFNVLLVILFFKRRTSVPLLVKVFYSAVALGLMLDAFLYALLDVEQLSGLAYSTNDLLRAIVSAAIWVPVFHLSERVKRTFTLRRSTFDDVPPGAWTDMETYRPGNALSPATPVPSPSFGHEPPTGPLTP